MRTRLGGGDVARRELMFAASADPGHVFDILATRWNVHAEEATSLRWTCLDTADWRLHRAGMTLRDTRGGQVAELVLQVGTHERIAAPSRVRAWPRRLTGLPASPVRERIADAVGVRALLPLAEVGVRQLPLRLLDDDGKTRVRVRVDQQRLVGTTRAPVQLRVLVSPVRGYERDGERCVELLTGALAAASGPEDASTAAMTVAGHTPGDGGPAAPTLDGAAPAAESFPAVLLGPARVMVAAREGVVGDVDPEYLHELHDALRVTRGLLRTGGDLLYGSSFGLLVPRLAVLDDAVAALRDLDALLLDIGDEPEPLRRHVARRRRAALRNVRALLATAQGDDSLLDHWRRALEHAGPPQLSGPTTSHAAAAAAEAGYDAVLGDEPSAADCANLCAVLTGWAPVCRAEPLAVVRAAIDPLAACLDEIADAERRRDTLTASATAISRQAAVETLLAIGALRERAAQREAAARNRLSGLRNAAAAPDVAAAVATLTGSAP